MVVFLLGTVVLLSLRHWQVHVWTQTLVCGQFKATGKHESCHRCLYPSGEWVSMWGFCDSSIPWCRFHWATGGTWEAVGLLKGPNYSKSALCDQEPTFYAHFQLIWKIRDNHMVPDLPSYVCFFSQVLLQTGLSSSTVPGWPTPSPSDVVPWWSYPQSTTITRTWPQTSVGQHLLKLQRLCAGHYWTQLVNICNAEALSRVPNPPSAVLKQLFSSSNGVISEDTIESAAKKVLLLPHECSIWMNHLRTVVENRHWEAQKAAATQRAKCSQAGGCRSGSSLSPPAANQVISESISACILILCVYSHPLRVCATCMMCVFTYMYLHTVYITLLSTWDKIFHDLCYKS